MLKYIFTLLLLPMLCFSAQNLRYGTSPDGFVVLFQGEATDRIAVLQTKRDANSVAELERSYAEFKGEETALNQYYQKRLAQYSDGDRAIFLESEDVVEFFKDKDFFLYQLCDRILEDLVFRYGFLVNKGTPIQSILLYELAVLYSYEKSLEYAKVFWEACAREGGVMAEAAETALMKAKFLIAKNKVSMNKVDPWQSFIFRGGAWVIAVGLAVLMTFIFLMKAGKPGFDDLLESNKIEEEKALLKEVSAKE